MDDTISSRREIIVIITHRQADITFFQGTGIIEPVSDHQHIGLLIFFQVGDVGQLVMRRLVKQ